MNIVLVAGGEIRMPPEEGGGAEAFIFNLSKQLSKMGHDVIVLDRNYSLADSDVEYIDGVRIIRLKAKRFTRFNFTINFVLSQVAFAFQVKKYLKRTKNSDIVHVYTSVLGLVLAMISKNIRSKLVYTSLGLRRDKASPSLADRIALALESQLVKRVRKTTIANEVIAAKLTRQARVRSQDVLVVPIGVDVEQYNPDLDVNDVRQRYDLEDKSTILFVGRLCAEKGVEYLIKAANILVNELGDRSLRFLLVGPTEQFGAGVQTHSSYMVKITKLIKEFGLQKDIKLTGTVPLDDLRALYVTCDMVVVPSIVDLDPQVQVEAMASGRPVIGTKMGTMPMRIKNGQSGFVIDPADERQLADRIKYLIDNPAEAKKMGTYARKLVSEQFASDKMAERLLQVYQSKE